MRSAHCTPFFMNRSTAAYAWVPARPWCSWRSGVMPPTPPLPMWKWTGRPASWATDHSGSQWGLPIVGRP